MELNVQVIVDTHHFSPPPLSLDRGVSAISIKEFNLRVGLGKHFIKFHGSRSLALFYFILFYFILLYFIFVAVKLVTVAFFFCNAVSELSTSSGSFDYFCFKNVS